MEKPIIRNYFSNSFLLRSNARTQTAETDYTGATHIRMTLAARVANIIQFLRVYFIYLLYLFAFCCSYEYFNDNFAMDTRFNEITKQYTSFKSI